MTQKSKFVRLFLAAALILTQLPLAGIAAITDKTETKLAAFPDTITGTLEGDVFDAGGLPIPGVSIRVTNLETGNTRATQTDAAGHYRITFLPLGVYKIEATKEGFFIKESSSIQSSIKIQVNKTFNRVPPIIMSAGPPPQAPAIAAAQPTPTPQQSAAPLAKDDITGQLTTQFDSTRRSNADEQMVALLPLANIRSFDDLALLAAGVAPPPQVRGAAGPGIGSGIGTPGQFSVNGQRARSNNFTVDGSDNNDEDVGVRRQGFVALVPQSIESVKEIQIVTHLWDAEQGRSIGSQVNAVSKSGSNQIHGTAYDFFNHSALNARNFFDYSSKNAPPTALTGIDAQQYVNGQPVSTRRIPVQINGTNVLLPNPSQGKDQFQRNQGGATLGFPILKERTFFFGSFERQDIKARQETHFAVPTVTQRGFLGFGATGFVARDDQGTGNGQVLPATFVAGDSVFSLFPFPNNPVGPYGANTLTQVLPADAHGTIFSMKFDHNFNLFGQATHILTGRYNFTDDEKQVPVVGGAIFSGVVPKVRTQNLSLFLNSQLSASRANQFRASYGRTALTFTELRDSFLQKPFFLPNESFLLNAPLLTNESGPINPVAVKYSTFGSKDVGGAEFTSLGPVGQVVVTPFSPVGLDVYLFPQARANNTIQFADTLTWFRASHIFKFGGDIRRTQLNSLLNRNYRPQILFGGTPDLTAQFSEAPIKNISRFGPTPGFFTGTDLASYGLPTGIFQSLAFGTPDSTIGLRFWQLNFFTNDNWRARRGLTLDYGGRYELNTVPREVNSRIEKTFALSQLPTDDPSLRLARQIASDRFQLISRQALLDSYNATINSLRQTVGNRDAIFDPDRNNFGGHVGFAWDPFASNKDQSGKTVIRGGIGAYYDLTLGSVVSQSRNVFPTSLPVNVDLNTFAYDLNRFYEEGGTGIRALYNLNFVRVPIVKDNQVTTSPLIGTSTQNQLNAIQLPSGILPQLLGLLFNPTVAGTLPSGGGLAFTLPNNNLRSPYALQYNLQIERELFSDFLVNLAYVGTRGVKLTRFRTPNGGPNSIAVPIDPLGLRQPDPILAVSLAPLSDPSPGGRRTRPNPNLGAFTIFDSSAASNYHSLQTSLSKRFSNGYQFTTAYTWSHAIDDVSDVFDVGGAFALPQDDRALQLERGSANFDIRHRLALSVIGNLPFLARFNDAGGAGKFFLGGWQFAALSTFQTGQPFTVNSSIDVNLDGNLTDRINTLKGLTNIDSRRERLRLTTGTSNLLAPLSTNGQIGRNTFRASGVAKTDFTLIKNFQLRGDHYIVLRTEVFNLLNRTHFALPVRVLEAPGFGQSVDTLVNPRQIQFALKYVF